MAMSKRKMYPFQIKKIHILQKTVCHYSKGHELIFTYAHEEMITTEDLRNKDVNLKTMWETNFCGCNNQFAREKKH